MRTEHGLQGRLYNVVARTRTEQYIQWQILVGAPYRVLLYQPGIRFSLRTNTKVSSLQHHPVHTRQVKDLYTSTLAFNIAQFFPLLNYQLLLLVVNKARFNPRISSFFSNYLLTEKPSMSGITLSLLNLGQMQVWAKILSSLPFYLLFILPQFLRKELKIFI